MNMGKSLTTNWHDAVAMLSDCRIVKAEVQSSARLTVLLRDPLGQQFLLDIVGMSALGLSGNIVTLNSGLQIICHETET